jgi:exosortase
MTTVALQSESLHRTRPAGGDPVLSRRDRLKLTLTLATLIALYAPTFVWLFDRWTMSVWHHAHGLLIPPVVGYYVWQELRLLGELPRSSSALGFAMLIPALALHIVDAAMHTQLLSAVSLVVALPGLSLLFLGIERTKAILFPLAFSVFMLPIPLSFTERIHLALRQVATAGSEPVIRFLGIPVFSEGTTLHLPNASLAVADACSGFSTLYAALAVACLVAYTTAGWRRFVVLVAAAPLAIAANLIRVILLVVVVRWTGVDVLHTWFHPFTGMLTFALSLPVIFWLGHAGQTRNA